MTENMTRSAQSILEDFEKNLKTLDGKVLETYTNQKFKIYVKSKTVEITPLSTGKLRSIEKEEILEAYNYLRQGDVIEGMGSGEKSIRGLGFSETNPAYFWAILKNFHNIETDNKKLNYKKPETDSIPIHPEFIEHPPILKIRSIDVTSAFGYKGATIQFKVKIENNTPDPISDIKFYPYVPDVFLLKEKEKSVALIEPKSSQTITFEIRPSGECGDCNVSGRVNYYDMAERKRQDIELKPKSLSIVCPMLNRKEIGEAEWHDAVSNLMKTEESTREIDMPADNLFTMVSRIVKDMNMYMQKPEISENHRLFNGVARFYGEGVKGLSYAAQVEVVGGTKKSKLILKAWAEKEDALAGFYHGMLDAIEKRIDVKSYIDEPIMQQYIHIGDRIGTKVDGDIVAVRSNIGAGARKCPNCGREVEANEKFCNECGAKL